MRSNHSLVPDVRDLSAPGATSIVSRIEIDLNSEPMRVPQLPDPITRQDKVTNSTLREVAFEGGVAEAFEFGIAASLDGYANRLSGLICIVEDCIIHPISNRKDEVVGSYDGNGIFSLSALGFFHRWKENFPEIEPQVLAILCGAHEGCHMLFEERNCSSGATINVADYESDIEEDACWKHAVGILKRYWPSAEGQLVMNGRVYSLEGAENNTLQQTPENGRC